MKRFPLLVTLLFLSAASSIWSQTESYDDVMLIVNDRSWASKEIGSYFAQRRGIPAWHICHIDIDTTETLDSTRFHPLKWQIQSWMRSRNLSDSINYIVTTKGCPLRIAAGGDRTDSGRFGALTSFEDCLVLMNGSDSSLMLSAKTSTSFPRSRYFGSTQRFKRDPGTLPYYLVTRLDAYTVDKVKSYILRAETPVLAGDGQWFLDIDPSRDGNAGYKPWNDYLRAAGLGLSRLGMNMVLETTSEYKHGQTDVIGYASWGSNDNQSGGGAAAKPGNTWLNGSIAETAVSTGGRTFNPPPSYGQSLVADWIEEGVCGVKGYTDEPYLFAVGHPDIIFDRYARGFNMAESFYAGSQVVAWRQVTIGDPKMKLIRLLAGPATTRSLGQGYKYMPLVDTVWIRNIYSTPVEITGASFKGDDSFDFRATVLGGSLPMTVAAGDSFAVQVGMSPSIYGTETSQLIVAHKRPSDSRTVNFSVSFVGIGIRPLLSYPTSVAFNDVPQNASQTRNISFVNGTLFDTIVISNVTLTGADASKFAIDPSVTFPMTILPGDSLLLPVTYTPGAPGQSTARLNFNSTSSTSLLRVNLSGNGTTSRVDNERMAFAARIISLSPIPTNGPVQMRYSLESSAHARVEIVDARGEVVSVLLDQRVSAGEHEIAADYAKLVSGHYRCRLIVDGRTVATQSVVIAK